MTFIVGLDIGGTRIKAGVVNAQGMITAGTAVPTPFDLEIFTSTITSIFSQLIADGEQPSGVGIGCKGIINPETSEVVVLPGPLAFLEGRRLRSFVSALPERTKVYADNDARVALAGEVIWGAARGRKNVVMLTLGTGVGGAVLAEGQILRGVKGAAGHLGHLTMDPDGQVCVCGNRGCLETIFSARAIEAQALHAVHRGCESILTERFGHNLHTLTCRDIFQAADDGDIIAKVIISQAVHALGAALAGLLHLFDPEIVIIGGQVSEAGEALFGPVREEIAWRTKRLLGREIPVIPPQVQDRSGVVGAAALALIPT